MDDYHKIMSSYDQQIKDRPIQKQPSPNQFYHGATDDGYTAMASSAISASPASVPMVTPQRYNKQSPATKPSKFKDLSKKLKNQKTKRDKKMNGQMHNQYGTIFPCVMKKQKLEEAQHFRDHLIYMIGAHCGFIILEIALYNFLIFNFIAEWLFLWLAYYSYMTLNWYTCVVYIMLMFFAPIGCFFFLVSVGNIGIVFYLGQIFIYAYYGALVSIKKFRAWTKSKRKLDYKKLHKQRNFNVKSKIQQMLQKGGKDEQYESDSKSSLTRPQRKQQATGINSPILTGGTIEKLDGSSTHPSQQTGKMSIDHIGLYSQTDNQLERIKQISKMNANESDANINNTSFFHQFKAFFKTKQKQQEDSLPEIYVKTKQAELVNQSFHHSLMIDHGEVEDSPLNPNFILDEENIHQYGLNQQYTNHNQIQVQAYDNPQQLDYNDGIYEYEDDDKYHDAYDDHYEYDNYYQHHQEQDNYHQYNNDNQHIHQQSIDHQYPVEAPREQSFEQRQKTPKGQFLQVEFEFPEQPKGSQIVSHVQQSPLKPKEQVKPQIVPPLQIKKISPKKLSNHKRHATPQVVYRSFANKARNNLSFKQPDKNKMKAVSEKDSEYSGSGDDGMFSMRKDQQ